MYASNQCCVQKCVCVFVSKPFQLCESFSMFERLLVIFGQTQMSFSPTLNHLFIPPFTLMLEGEVQLSLVECVEDKTLRLEGYFLEKIGSKNT